MEKIPDQPTPREKKNEDEEDTLMSRRGFLKKVAVTGGVIATGGLANLMVDEAKRENKKERERTEIGPGVVIDKEIEKPSQYNTHPTDNYYIHVAVGAYTGRFEVTNKPEYDSYAKGENVTVEYVPGIPDPFAVTGSTTDVWIKSVKK